MRFIFFLFLSFLFIPSQRAQVFEDIHFRTEAKKGLDKVYNLEFEAGNRIFGQLRKAYPEHPAPYFLLALNRWWQSYISTSPYYHTYILEQLEKSLTLNESLAKKESLALEYTFFQYMGFAFKTRLYILQKEWVKAANNGRKALKYLEKGFDFRQQAPEFYFSSGIYHYYAATYPETHTYVKPFMVFFPDGDEKLGLEELNKASVAQNFTQIEALYYLGDIYLEEKKAYPEALKLKSKLYKTYPQNTWFAADYARSLIFTNQYSKALGILEGMQEAFESQSGYMNTQMTSIHTRYTSLLMMRVYHYLGICTMRQKAAYEKASVFFEQSMEMARIAKVETDPHLPANMYHLGICKEKLGMLERAKIAYQNSLEMDENDGIKLQAKERLKRLK